MSRNSSQTVQAAIRCGLRIKELLREGDTVGALGSYGPHRSPGFQKNSFQTLNSSVRI